MLRGNGKVSVRSEHASRLRSPGISGEVINEPGGNALQLILGIGSFMTCFAAVGTLAATLPILTERLQLSERQVGLAVAMPVFLGSLCRIPFGLLADRFGARRVLMGVLAFAILPTSAMAVVHSYAQLLVVSAFLGVALAVFSVGVTLVSSWYPQERQGTALGILGFGNVGHSLAFFGAPLLATAVSLPAAYLSYSGLLVVWLVLVAMLAEDAPRVERRARSIAYHLKPLGTRACWSLSLFYFLTFGGFLAMAGYMPKFLTLTFHLSKGDAGFRSAGFVVFATVMRPVGGWLADRVGARRILLFVFPAVAVLAICLACPSMIMFTVGALGIATAIGLGNGAVFKLVPHYFPNSVGAATGLVGAAGALGGFFPPIVLGLIRGATGTFTPGFVLLSLFALGCLAVCVRTREDA